MFASFAQPAGKVDLEVVFLRQNSEPKYAQEESKKGLCDLVYDEIISYLTEKKIATKTITTLLPIKRILRMQKTGEGHVFCGATKNPGREAEYLFSKRPVYSISNVLMAHKDTHFFPEKLADLASGKYKIGAFFGTASADFIKSYAAKNVDAQYTSVENAIKLVSLKKLDYFFYHDLALSNFAKTSKFPVHVSKIKYRALGQYIMMSKKLPPSVVDHINQKLDELYESNKIDKICDQFLN